MITEITIQLENKPGVHLRVVGMLKKLGLVTTDLKLKIAPSGGKFLTLAVDGDGTYSDTEIHNQIATVQGVTDVMRVGDFVSGEMPSVSDEQIAHAAPAPGPARQPTEAEKRFKNFNSEAGDEDIRDRMLVFSLLSRYPALAARLIELRGSIPEEDRETRFYQIGRAFGRQLYANLKVKGEVPDTSTAIERVLMPAITPLAQANATGNLIKIDIYDKKFDKGVQNPLNCIFFQGMLDGLLQAAPGLGPTRAYKTKCIHTHDVICEYNIVGA